MQDKKTNGSFANCLTHSGSSLKEEMLLDVGSAPLVPQDFITKLYFPEEICRFIVGFFLPLPTPTKRVIISAAHGAAELASCWPRRGEVRMKNGNKMLMLGVGKVSN